MIVPDNTSPVQVGREGLRGLLGLPRGVAQGLVIFAHGSGSGRLSPRNQHVAEGLRGAGLATLLLDLLTPTEEANRANVFDIELLVRRLQTAVHWARQAAEVRALPIGFFGASTGAGAALVAAAALGSGIGAVVSRGGRPDLAASALPRVAAPTLLIVGGNDAQVIDLNRQALDRLKGRKSLVVVPGAGHLFEEPGKLDEVIDLAATWFLDFLPAHTALPTEFPHFENRRDAARHLAAALQRFRDEEPIVLALPRGGVPIGYEVAMALDAPLEVVLVRKIGAPGHEEYGLGAVVDGNDPQTVLNEDVVALVRPPPGYIASEQKRQLAEIERRKELYLHGRPSLSVKGRLVIVVDDGIATGGTVKAVLKAMSRNQAARVVLAVPVAPHQAVAELSQLADEVVCLASPTPFHAVGLHYRNFEQTTDEEVVELLDLAAQRPPGHGRPAAVR